MKILPIALLASVVLSAHAAQGEDDSRSNPAPEARPGFLEPGMWWNFYFADGSDPLKRGAVSIKAVKILQFSERHPSWVQIAFPKRRKEHFSILEPAAKAHDDDSVDLDAALAEWEESITQWSVIWVNLDFVVRISKVEQSDTTEPRATLSIDRGSSPPGR